MEVSDIQVGSTLVISVQGVDSTRVEHHIVRSVGMVTLDARGTERLDLAVEGPDGLVRAAEYANAGGSAITLDFGGAWPALVGALIPPRA
jgi:hypothetical protein